MKTYFRPLSLVFGPDARALIAAGKAGALGGMAHIGFTHIEVIERGAGRMIETFADLSDLVEIENITKPRPAFGGVSMSATQVMGIVNVTPDSFSDGGRLSNAQAAIDHGLKLASEGAVILDVGGESTRPGSQLKMKLPVLKASSQVFPKIRSSRLTPAKQQ
jgi:dihydropteroate synthase